MMRVTVRVAIARHVRDEVARRLAALVPSPTTVAATDARRGQVIELGTPEEPLPEVNRDN